MEDLSNYYGVVEECIGRLGVEPAQCRGEKDGQWNLKKGEISVWIDLWHIELEGRAYFQVMTPILQVPEKNKEALYEELLSLNDSLFGVAFTIYKNWVYLKVIREAMGMDANEAFAMLTRVGNYADDYTNKLQEKYFSNLRGDRRNL